MADINYNVNTATDNPLNQETGDVIFGKVGDSTIFIFDGTEWVELEYEEFNIKIKQNQVSEFFIRLPDIETAEKVYVKEYTEIMFFSSLNLILKGRIQKVSYQSAYECEVTGYGMEAVLLDKEFIKSSDKRVQYTNESAQTIANEILSENSDGVTPWIMDPATTGIFATDYGSISMRYEYANRLSSLAKLTEAMSYEWDVTQSLDYETDYFNLAPLLPSTTRATTSQETFLVTGSSANCTETSNEKDVSNLSNKIDCLGYGDGVNQAKTSTYNASATYSTLSTNITSSATTIRLTDASAFATSGEIRIMEERVTYTGKSANDLTGCTRGTSSTTALEHKSGIFVEKYVAIASAETGSSIDDNGLSDYTIIEREILDVATLELIASKELLKRMDPIQRINITPDEAEDTVKELKVGDLITITDTEADLDDDFRIVGIEFASYYGDLQINLECSNRTLTFIEQMTKQRQEAEALGKYMQGSTNIYAINEAENCDNDGVTPHPLNMKFYISDETVAINKVKLNLITDKYRADSKSVTSAPESQTNTTIWTSAALASIIKFVTPTWKTYLLSTGGTALNETGPDRYYLPTTTDMSSYENVPPGTGPTPGAHFPWIDGSGAWSTKTAFSAASYLTTGGWATPVSTESEAADLTGDFDKIRISFSLHNGITNSSGTKIIASPTIYLERSPNGTTWTNVNTYTPSMAVNDIYQNQEDETTDYRGYLYRVRVDNFNPNNPFDTSWITLNVTTYLNSTDDLDYGISEETWPTGTPKLKIEVGPVGSEVEVTSSPFTITDGGELDIDISDAVRNVGAGNWCNIKYTPQDGTSHNRIRIEADAYVKLFIESTD